MHHRRRLAAILLAFPGVLAAHLLAYQWVNLGPLTTQNGVGHGYLPTAVPVGASLGVVTLLWLAVAGVRAAGTDARPPAVLLIAVQLGIFVIQELGEHLFSGYGPAALLAEPAFWLGLALQGPVALLLLGLVRLGRQIATRLLSPSPVVPPGQGQVWLPIFTKFVRPLVVLPVGLRGPPLFV